VNIIGGNARCDSGIVVDVTLLGQAKVVARGSRGRRPGGGHGHLGGAAEA
jgi:hypothetical protein